MIDLDLVHPLLGSNDGNEERKVPLQEDIGLRDLHYDRPRPRGRARGSIRPGQARAGMAALSLLWLSGYHRSLVVAAYLNVGAPRDIDQPCVLLSRKVLLSRQASSDVIDLVRPLE